MSVKISIPSAFRRHTEGLDNYSCTAQDLNELLDALGSPLSGIETSFAG